jgi:hypothetical protein
MELLGRHSLFDRRGGWRRTAFSLDNPAFIRVGHPVIVGGQVEGELWRCRHRLRGSWSNQKAQSWRPTRMKEESPCA